MDHMMFYFYFQSTKEIIILCNFFFQLGVQHYAYRFMWQPTARMNEILE